MIITYQIKP